MLLLNLMVLLMLNIFVSFTFQYASIKPGCYGLTKPTYIDLHFNMLLLNHRLDGCRGMGIYQFTFQYASIKPPRACTQIYGEMYLHFNMLLLNRISPFLAPV